MRATKSGETERREVLGLDFSSVIESYRKPQIPTAVV